MPLHERQLFLQNLAQTSDTPLMLEIYRAKGVYLFSPYRKKYIDLISGIGVSNVGHSHPRVLKAIRQQSERYLHLMVYGEYVQSPQTQLAKKLVSMLPQHLDNVYFVNSGSEAIEGAMKLAKRFTGRTELVSCLNAYHGSSHGALSIGGSEHFKNAYRPLLPDIRQIRFGEMADLELITRKTAGVIIETVQGEAGVRVPSAEYMQALRKRCTETETLLVLDEIQAGFGRTGKFWAFEHFGIEPDVLVTAKAMGGGMPLGAFISSKEIMAVLKNNPILGHITTFGGHPVSCAASLASMEVIENEQLVSQIPQKEALFRKLLTHPLIREIRSCGLMMAVEFENFEILKKIIDKTIEKGAITDWFLFCDNSMRIAPPLIITEKQIKKACTAILEACEEVNA